MSAAVLGWQRRHLAVCGSTNDEAAALGRAGAPHGTVVTADQQTAGRGRLGRSWHSPAAENLYLSVLLRPPLTPVQAPLLTLCAGVALAEVVSGLLAHVELKWPNDLLWAPPGQPPRKLAGILTEMVCRGGAIDFVVVGLGINLNGTDFPAELAERATSLRLARQQGVDRAALVETLLTRLDADYHRFLREGAAPLLVAYRGHAAFLRRSLPMDVRSGDEVFRATPLDLAEDGALLVRDEAGHTRRLVAGELT